jgi:hypothetical protein
MSVVSRVDDSISIPNQKSRHAFVYFLLRFPIIGQYLTLPFETLRRFGAWFIVLFFFGNLFLCFEALRIQIHTYIYMSRSPADEG